MREKPGVGGRRSWVRTGDISDTAEDAHSFAKARCKLPYTGLSMPVRIAIPEPTSADEDYNQRSLPPYLAAIEAAGASSLIIRLTTAPDQIARALADVHGVLLPGSLYDVDPQRFNEDRIPQCGPADPARAAADELLLQDAFNLRKPILAICHGAQTLNVWRNGTLIQDIETVLRTSVNHRPGRDVTRAHPVRLTPGSRLAALDPSAAQVFVNSSHHQAIGKAGDNLRIAAVSPADGVIEAVELDSPDHFVMAVQWHPERSYGADNFSRKLFAVFVQAAGAWQLRQVAASMAAR